MHYFDGNYYWVPGTQREDVKVLQYSDRLKIYLARECLAEYPLPAEGVKNKQFSPPDLPAPRYQPKNRRHPTQEEEKRLRALAPEVSSYLERIALLYLPRGDRRTSFCGGR